MNFCRPLERYSIRQVLSLPCKEKPTGLLNSRSAWQQAPHPRLVKERVAAWARPRPSGNTLFTLFWGGEGKRKKTVEKPWKSLLTRLISVHTSGKVSIAIKIADLYHHQSAYLSEIACHVQQSHDTTSH